MPIKRIQIMNWMLISSYNRCSPKHQKGSWRAIFGHRANLHMSMCVLYISYILNSLIKLISWCSIKTLTKISEALNGYTSISDMVRILTLKAHGHISVNVDFKDTVNDSKTVQLYQDWKKHANILLLCTVSVI